MSSYSIHESTHNNQQLEDCEMGHVTGGLSLIMQNANVSKIEVSIVSNRQVTKMFMSLLFCCCNQIAQHNLKCKRELQILPLGGKDIHIKNTKINIYKCGNLDSGTFGDALIHQSSIQNWDSQSLVHAEPSN